MSEQRKSYVCLAGLLSVKLAIYAKKKEHVKTSGSQFFEVERGMVKLIVETSVTPLNLVVLTIETNF